MLRLDLFRSRASRFLSFIGFTVAAASPALAGFSVQNGVLRDNNGNAFVMRGINHPHVWYTSQTGSAIPNIAATGANCVRLVLGNGRQWGPNSQTDVANLIALCKTNRLIAIPEVHDCTGFGDTGGAAPNAAPLSTAVDYWISIQGALKGQENFVIINIANEPFGNGVSASTWVNEHITAITRLRNAGFTHTLMVDAANWGQDWQNIMRDNAAQVFNADPLRNVVFSVHMYEVYQQDSTINSYMSAFANARLPLLVGEFAATHGSSDVNEGSIMQRAQQYGFGYIGWSWSGNGSPNQALDIVTNFNPSQRTTWGSRLITGANGISSTSQICSVFTSTPTLTVSPTSMSFGSAAGAQSATISSNTSWTVTDNQSWISVTPTSGSNNATLSVSVTQNTGASRSGTVTVSGGGVTRTIAVSQSAAGGGSTITRQAESGTVGGGTTIDSNNGGYNGTGFANFPTTGGWLQLSSVSGGSATGTRTVTVRYALGATSSRTGRVLVNGVAQNITFQPSGSWTTWVTMTFNATLNSGTGNTIRFESTGQDLGNIDQISYVVP